MVCAITFVTAHNREMAEIGAINTVTQAISKIVNPPLEENWLHQDEALQLIFPSSCYQDLAFSAGKVAAQYGLDYCVSSQRPKPLKLLLADMEATIISQEMIDELARKVGCSDLIPVITQQAMEGKIDFEQSVRQRTQFFKDIKIEVLNELQNIISYSPGAQTLVRTMAHLGAETVLVSGGYGIFAHKVASACGFDLCFSNHVEINNELLTGELINPIFDAQTKCDVLDERCLKLGISRQEACSIGDGANDSKMLAASGLAASYHGKQEAVALADLAITHGDLTALLFAQGIKRKDFVN